MLLEEFNKSILASNPKSILDVGSGHGRFFDWANKWSISYKGIDIDPDVVKKSILKYRDAPNFDPDTFQVANGKDLSNFADKSFDTILLVEVVEHIENLATLNALLQECIRVAKLNIMITTPNCSDEDFLRQHKVIYDHFTHSVGQGYDFKYDDSHKHHIRFTKESLSIVLTKLNKPFEVQERVPLKLRSLIDPNRVMHYKLWAEIRCQ
jgi:SAM-dependent methyltransferase